MLPCLFLFSREKTTSIKSCHSAFFNAVKFNLDPNHRQVSFDWFSFSFISVIFLRYYFTFVLKKVQFNPKIPPWICLHEISLTTSTIYSNLFFLRYIMTKIYVFSFGSIESIFFVTISCPSFEEVQFYSTYLHELTRRYLRIPT